MAYGIVPVIIGEDLSNIQIQMFGTSGYTHGQNHTLTINGTLIGLSWYNYLQYSFTKGKAILKDGSTINVSLNTRNLKNVETLSFSISSNNSVNGTGACSVTYIAQ